MMLPTRLLRVYSVAQQVGATRPEAKPKLNPGDAKFWFRKPDPRGHYKQRIRDHRV